MKRHIEEIFNELPVIDSDNSEFCKTLYRNTTVQERIDYAIDLVNTVNRHSEQILLILLHDKSPLVQAEAADSLSAFCSKRVYRSLMELSNSKYVMVRGYALRGIGYVVPDSNRQEAKSLLSSKLSLEKSTFAKIQIFLSLCVLEDDKALTSLVKMYPKCGYQNKCAILNGISDLMEEGHCIDKSIVSRFVDSSSPSIEDVAVLDSIDRLKSILTEPHTI